MKLLKRVLKWSGLGLLILVLIVIVISEYKLRAGPEPVAVTLDLPTDVASLAEGERLAKTRGCTGCHRENLAGGVFFDSLIMARIIAPNLTTGFQSHSSADIEAAIRQGIGHDGQPLVLMPSGMFSYLSDEDTALILAYVKSRPEVENDLPGNFFGPVSRVFLALGVFLTATDDIANKPALQLNADQQPVLAKGEYLAMTLCTECHGIDLKGVNQGDFSTPDLVITTAYNEKEFSHLMKTGKALGGRELGLMSKVAKNRFSLLRADEITAMYAFLKLNPDKGRGL